MTIATITVYMPRRKTPLIHKIEVGPEVSLKVHEAKVNGARSIQVFDDNKELYYSWNR